MQSRLEKSTLAKEFWPLRGVLPPPPSPRPGGQGRRQRLMPRRAAAETRPDSRPDPRTPGSARTLKLSSRRHGPPARRPPAPLLSGLLTAHAQCRRPPRLRALRACACVQAGWQRRRRKRRQGPLAVRRPSPTR
ncbi:proline-rich protein 18-like [Theropithecus gelada]|uniref:proline-rich protein 18-like n=1 Tax=Theropithecus gelada TaxID=9565 RepID=UPI000DC17F1D|nr:proline-rich protein 18-like [Theropithecus gelada]